MKNILQKLKDRLEAILRTLDYNSVDLNEI